MKLQEMIADFEEIVMVDSGTVNMETKLNELEEWDSLAQIALLTVLEEKLGVKIGVTALTNLTTFADIVELVTAHLE